MAPPSLVKVEGATVGSYQSKKNERKRHKVDHLMDDLNVRLGIWCIAGRLFFEPEVFSHLILRIILIHSIDLGNEGIALSRLTLSFIVHSLIQIVTNFYSSFTYSTEECCKTSFPHCLLKKQASILKLKHQATNMINYIIYWFSWSPQP